MMSYFVLVIAAVTSFILARSGRSNWISVGLPTLIPVVLIALNAIVVGRIGSIDGETMRFLLLFGLAALFQYGFVCAIAAAIGRRSATRKVEDPGHGSASNDSKSSN